MMVLSPRQIDGPSRVIRRRSIVLILGSLIALSAVGMCCVGSAAEPAAKDAAFFTEKVQPILAASCFKCHSHATGKSSGGLMLDSLGAMLAGGDSGAALTPGSPDKSLLVEAIGYENEDLRMPPKQKLSAEQIATLTEWVKLGAPWPGSSGKIAARPRGRISDEDRRWWAFQPIADPPLPAVIEEAWASNPIDRFIRARLDVAGLQPSPPAERAALLRRVYFDLIGLPPSPEEIGAFVADTSPAAYEQLIDRLLDSPRYGERWARHWLDLARYAESDGYRIDDYRPVAWRYRDYVIRSLNADKPYDQFLREQLAGDELAPRDPESQLATSFLRLGIYEYNNRDVRGQWTTMLNDVTDVASDLFLGLGVGCARCHDHKFDPILQQDYFRLQAFFAPMLPQEDTPNVTAAEFAAFQEQRTAWETAAADALKAIEAVEEPKRLALKKQAIGKFPEELQAMLNKPLAERSPLETQLAALAYRQVTYEFDRLDRNFKDQDKERLIALRKELTKHEALLPPPLPLAMTVRDVGREAPITTIPKKSTAVEPGFLTVLDEKPASITPPADLASTGRRTALAEWLTRPDHPLTSRVMVNRIWQYHFGRGLVATSSDFGRLGDPPTHPELLDYLARRFMQGGWSLKKIHRLMLTSATYRQSAVQPAPPLALRVDPENRLLWRMGTRRLDAEQIRDALLAATGRLDLTAGGPAVEPREPRRSIYLKVFRNQRDPLLDVFDAPDGFASTAQRNVTTTPTQSLLMINSSQMLAEAKAFAQRLKRDQPSAGSASKDEARISQAFWLAFGRAPRDSERQTALAFLDSQQQQTRPKLAVAGGTPAHIRITPAHSSGTSPDISGTPLDIGGTPPDISLQLEKMPYREGRAALLQPQGPMRCAHVPESGKFPQTDFTIEAFVVLRSAHEDATVRTIAAHWSGDPRRPGWSFGVTGKKSRYKPQTLVLQLWGDTIEGTFREDAVFSSLHLEVNKPYFVAASVNLGDVSESGVTFYLKDLSNDDDPLLQSSSGHKVISIGADRGLFTLGGTAETAGKRTWDGLVDDVRLSRRALASEQLLFTREEVNDATVGYWRFEPQPGVLKDAAAGGQDIVIEAQADSAPPVDPATQALIDFCHVLLNANEFLYVD